MIPKQSEMDGIVKEIYTALETKEHLSSTLLVVCGDHGMNDAGNHGGSAESETSPALVFMSQKLRSVSKGAQCPSAPVYGDFNYYSTVEQSDVAPTIAGLLGFPVPLNNLGVFIPDFLTFWEGGKCQMCVHILDSANRLVEEQVGIVWQNALQILGIVKETFPHHDFEQSSTIRSTQEAISDGEALEILWNIATVPLVDGRPMEQADRIHALRDVRSLFLFEHLKS